MTQCQEQLRDGYPLPPPANDNRIVMNRISIIFVVVTLLIAGIIFGTLAFRFYFVKNKEGLTPHQEMKRNFEPPEKYDERY